MCFKLILHFGNLEAITVIRWSDMRFHPVSKLPSEEMAERCSIFCSLSARPWRLVMVANRINSLENTPATIQKHQDASCWHSKESANHDAIPCIKEMVWGVFVNRTSTLKTDSSLGSRPCWSDFFQLYYPKIRIDRMYRYTCDPIWSPYTDVTFDIGGERCQELGMMWFMFQYNTKPYINILKGSSGSAIPYLFLRWRHLAVRLKASQVDGRMDP